MNQSLLSQIDSPKDLKKLSVDELPALCAELRAFIINQLSHGPGHFAASLGVVELTVALHYVYDTPDDKLIWDVGHQAYGHKILTGRRDQFYTNRKKGGLSGFPNIFESEYDAFGTGHSSTSISAALGMATAYRLAGEKNKHVVAVIGDGAMTGGEAFEALNNMATGGADMLVILNDNNMAIDQVTGSLSQYLLDITTSKTYNKLRHHLGNSKRSLWTRLTSSLKNLISHSSNMFEGLNIRYFGPADGHDVRYLVSILSDLKKIDGPKLLHVITTKGKGFRAAEENPTKWHAVGSRFDPETGEPTDNGPSTPQPPRFQDVFGQTIVELARSNEKIVGITPAMPSGCGLITMMKEMPDRCFDVGIAEQHAVTFAAGMAISGYVPFCNIYSTFAQRAFDQLIHDVALQKLHVVFCFDRAGLVGPDGATHHGAFDISMLRPVPNLTIMSPMDEVEMRHMMYTAQMPENETIVIRYPRGRGSVIDWQKPMKKIERGTARLLRRGDGGIALLSFGPIGTSVAHVADRLQEVGISATHIDMRFAKPIDTHLLDEILPTHHNVMSIEDGTKIGGIGSAVLEYANEKGYKVNFTSIGLPDEFVAQGTIDELYADCGMDEESIYRSALSMMGK